MSGLGLGLVTYYGQFNVIIRVRAELELGLGLMFDPNNLLTLTIATKLTLTQPLNPNLPNLIMNAWEPVANTNFAGGQTRTHQTHSSALLIKQSYFLHSQQIEYRCMPY